MRTQRRLQRGVRSRSDVFYAIGALARRRLLDALASGEMPVNDLARPFGMTRPAVSQHLRILLDVGLVSVRRVGRERRYCLQANRLRQVYDWVAHYERFWPEKLKALGAYLDRQAGREKRVNRSKKGDQRSNHET